MREGKREEERGREVEREEGRKDKRGRDSRQEC